MQLRICEFAGLGRHLIRFAAVDHGHNGVFTPSMQPNIVSEVGRAQGLIALAIGTMADRALGLEQRGCAADGSRVGLAARQGGDIFGQVIDLRAGQELVASKGRHLRLACIGMGRANTDAQGMLDGVQIAAPYPDIIAQVWIALAAGPAGPVTGGAIVPEDRGPCR